MINNINNTSMARSLTTSKNSRIPTVPDDMLTNKQPSMSACEFDARLMEIARRDVAAGTNSRGITNGKKLRTDDWFKLSQEYISSASPAFTVSLKSCIVTSKL